MCDFENLFLRHRWSYENRVEVNFDGFVENQRYYKKYREQYTVNGNTHPNGLFPRRMKLK